RAHHPDPPPSQAPPRRRGADRFFHRQGPAVHLCAGLDAGQGARRRVVARPPHPAAAAAEPFLMRAVRLQSLNDFDEWRGVARALLLGGTPPEDISWSDASASTGLFDAPEEVPGVTGRKVGTVPPRFIELAQAAICHND